MPKDNHNIKDAKGFLKYLTTGWPDNVFLHIESMTPVMTKGGKPDIQRWTVAPADTDKPVASMGYYKARNYYFTVNPLSGPSGTGEGGAATKADIACAVCVHLDLDPADPPAGSSPDEKIAHLQTERQRLRKLLDDFTPAPSFLIDSGGGYQAFWRLVTPATVDEAEAVNKALCDYFKTPDRCHSAQHLMRMPFTQNVPGYAKKAKGRAKVEARLLYATAVMYTLEDFALLPRVAAKASASAALAAVPGDLPARFVELLQGDEELRSRWEGDPGDMDDQSRNALDMSITSRLVRHGFNDAEVSQILHGFPHGKVHQDGRGADYITPMIKLARAQRHLTRKTPRNTARRLLAERFTSPDGVRLLRYWNGVFYGWSGAYYQRDKDGVVAEVGDYLETARQYIGKDKKTGKDRTEPYAPTPAMVANVVDSLAAVTYQDSRFVQPCWMDGADGADPRDLLVMTNGMLHMPTRKLQAHDQRLFTTTALPFAYAPDAAPPRVWLAFLASVWGDDAESIELLQEYMGNCLTADCSQQKILLIVGPPRSGKGTILRVLTALVGAANTCSPTLDSIAERFGLEPLIDKRLALFSDVRLDGRTSQKALAGKLLPLSGEDQLTIDRKGKPTWTGTLGVRLVIATNELPMIADASGALASRLAVLAMTRSFRGVEDTTMIGKLLAELPAILNWSLDGLERLKARGAFRQPESAMELVQELGDLGSPISDFIRECCVIEPNTVAVKDDLYDRWKGWCMQQGWKEAGTKKKFYRDLRAALPHLNTVRPRSGDDKRPRAYQGIGLVGGPHTLEDLRRGPLPVDEVTAMRRRKESLL